MTACPIAVLVGDFTLSSVFAFNLRRHCVALRELLDINENSVFRTVCHGHGIPLRIHATGTKRVQNDDHRDDDERCDQCSSCFSHGIPSPCCILVSNKLAACKTGAWLFLLDGDWAYLVLSLRRTKGDSPSSGKLVSGRLMQSAEVSWIAVARVSGQPCQVGAARAPVFFA